MSFFNDFFDFNHDGNTDFTEKVFAFSLLDDILSEDSQTELELSGLDPDELEFMDYAERREALENAGLDPDEYDF